jgi:hypothetical protein
MLLPTYIAVADTWPEVLSLSAGALIMCGGWVKYAGYRVRAGRKKKETWTDIATDGAKPMTGSVWADAAIFLGVILLGAAFIGYFLLKMKTV